MYIVFTESGLFRMWAEHWGDASSIIHMDGVPSPFQVADARHNSDLAADMLAEWADLGEVKSVIEGADIHRLLDLLEAISREAREISYLERGDREGVGERRIDVAHDVAELADSLIWKVANKGYYRAGEAEDQTVHLLRAALGYLEIDCPEVAARRLETAREKIEEMRVEADHA